VLWVIVHDSEFIV